MLSDIKLLVLLIAHEGATEPFFIDILYLGQINLMFCLLNRIIVDF